MPHRTPIDCPRCEKPLIRKTGGRCPSCGEVVTEHVARARLREKRIEQVIAILATVAVLTLLLWAGGAGLVEGVVVYALVGLGIWYWGKGTFWSATFRPEPTRGDEPDRPPDGDAPRT